MHNRLLEKLSEKQIEAVTETEGKIKVVAGAGSGKTRVLSYRYAYLVNELGIDPANILCLTFTNKAAQEMKSRIYNLVDQSHVNDYICTIHGFCAKLLRREIHRIGYPQNFMVLDAEDSKNLAKEAMSEFQIDGTNITVKKFLSKVLTYKVLNPYITQILLPESPPIAEASDAIVYYIQLQRKYYALDFHDMIAMAIYILDHFQDACDYWQNEINYVMVDEAQDCNGNDWKIINTLSNIYGNLFIVGDPDQAIYEWRGSNPDYFIDFCADKEIILNENYRSTPDILNVANSIISKNQKRIPKDLFTQKNSADITIHYHGKSESEEAEWIATQIGKLIKNGSKDGDIAILYRSSHLSRPIEQALSKKQIKYVIWGGIRFFERKEIKDVLSYLRLIVYKDDISFKRIVNVPSRKFGKATMTKLQELADKEHTLLYDTLIKYQNIFPFNQHSFLAFIQLIEECKKMQDVKSISYILDYILENSGLAHVFRTDGDQERLDNLSELLNSIRYYEETYEEDEISLTSYLQNIALFTNADYKADGPTVKLMTVHQAKGLEFPFVFVCGLSEGIFPNHRTIRERKKDGEEEERRLMYVAVTRAEKALFLTESEGFLSDNQEKYPSRFLNEVDESLIKVEGEFDPMLFIGTQRQVDGINSQICVEDFVRPIQRFNVGDKVIHKHFGIGIIEDFIEKKRSYKIDFSGKLRMIRGDYNLLRKAKEPVQFLPYDIIQGTAMLYVVKCVSEDTIILYSVFNRKDEVHSLSEYFELICRFQINGFYHSSKLLLEEDENAFFQLSCYEFDSEGDFILKCINPSTKDSFILTLHEFLVWNYKEVNENIENIVPPLIASLEVQSNDIVFYEAEGICLVLSSDGQNGLSLLRNMDGTYNVQSKLLSVRMRPIVGCYYEGHYIDGHVDYFYLKEIYKDYIEVRGFSANCGFPVTLNGLEFEKAVYSVCTEENFMNHCQNISSFMDYKLQDVIGTGK